MPPALELPLQLLLLLLRLRELGLLLALFALLRKETNKCDLVIKFLLRRNEHTYLLTSSPSEFNILFVLEEFPSHALDCGVPPSCARTNEVGEVFLSDFEQVVRISVPVIDNVVVNKISQGVFLLNTPATRGSVG